MVLLTVCIVVVYVYGYNRTHCPKLIEFRKDLNNLCR